MLGDLFYRLGSAAGTLTAQISALGEPFDVEPREVAVYDGDGDAVHDPDSDPAGEPDDDADYQSELADDEDDHSSAAVIGAAWLLSSLFRARPVNWPRVILSGMAATALADLTGRLLGPAADDRGPLARDPQELRDRFGAGVAIAAGYAAILYPRIPGPPLFRGLMFGVIEIATAPLGGFTRRAALAPGVRFPLQRMVEPVAGDTDPISHMAFGLALGLLYRND